MKRFILVCVAVSVVAAVILFGFDLLPLRRKVTAPIGVTRSRLNELALALMLYAEDAAADSVSFADAIAVPECLRGRVNASTMHLHRVLEGYYRWSSENSKEYDGGFVPVDYWGRPIVFIAAKDYEDQTLAFDLGSGVETRMAILFGSYIFPNSFQMWSVGPNGVNQGAGGDDIALWHRWPDYDAQLLSRTEAARRNSSDGGRQ